MKRIFLMIGILSLIVVLSGCVGAKVNNYGFPSPPPGIIYANAQTAQYLEEKMVADKTDFTVLGKGESSATILNVLLLVSLGDASLDKLKKDAMAKYKGADDIIDVEVDCDHQNILGIINNVTTKFRGTVIKYKK